MHHYALTLVLFVFMSHPPFFNGGAFFIKKTTEYLYNQKKDIIFAMNKTNKN